MSRSNRGLIVVVAVGLAAAAAGWLKWRDRGFQAVAESIDPCDDEKVLLYKTARLGPPEREEPAGEGRVALWRRNGKVLSVLLMPTASSPRPVAVSVRLEVERPGRTDEAQPAPLYEDASGLQRCK